MSTMRCWFRFAVIMVGIAAGAGLAAAKTLPSVSLNACQNTVRSAGKTYVQNAVAALDNCLQRISTEIVKKNAADASGAAAVCVTEFRKLMDSRHRGRSLPEMLQMAIVRSCTPGGSKTHTLGDILGSGAGVPQPLAAMRLGRWCIQFGGDGSIDTLQEWIDCEAAALTCEARQAVAAQYPRALEWLTLVKAAMQVLTPPANDPQQITDAVAGLDAAKAAIDGPDGDNSPSIRCGTWCGDGVKNGSDQCDGTDLGGTSCVTLGFDGGTLGCTPTCGFDISGCAGTTSRLTKTGETSCADDSGAVIPCNGTGQDGEFQAGADLSYVDNGDGTITDLSTKLTWEKLARDGSIHDTDNLYTWDDAIAGKIATLNSIYFAGYSDWRLPNHKELLSIVNLQNINPAVSPVFNTACVPGCSITTCSCTGVAANGSFDGEYWSATTDAAVPTKAWVVSYYDGYVSEQTKTLDPLILGFPVRAVRGGWKP